MPSRANTLTKQPCSIASVGMPCCMKAPPTVLGPPAPCDSTGRQASHDPQSRPKTVSLPAIQPHSPPDSDANCVAALPPVAKLEVI
jgi:hypothetical protein